MVLHAFLFHAVFTSAAKAAHHLATYGAAEAAPFQNSSAGRLLG